MKKIFILTLFIFTLGCSLFPEDDEKSTWENLPSCSSDPIFTHLPMDKENILNFIPLGAYNPPGHVFPTDHHYFDKKMDKGVTDIYAATDGWIISVSKVESTGWSTTQYSLELAPCNKIKIKYGHLTVLDPNILNQLGSKDGSEFYTTGGDTYEMSNYNTKIFVKAGDKIAQLLDLPDASGIDFGSIDLRTTPIFINPDRFDNFGYINTVSLVNYATPQIKTTLYNFIQYNNETTPLRTATPIEGQFAYDVPGSVQGLWFKPNTSTTPEDPHLALIKNPYSSNRYVFSMGTSVTGLTPQPYEFVPEANGSQNRKFDEIIDYQIYSYTNFKGFWGEDIAPGVVILIQKTPQGTLKIEKQTSSDGPFWNFTSNVVEFER